jgi:hypothetical protein
MKAFFASVVLLLIAIPSFGSHAQPSLSSQFRLNSRATRKGNQKPAQKPHGKDLRKPSSHSSSNAIQTARSNSVRQGRFSNKVVSKASSIPTVSFLDATRTATAGESDDETEPVIGDFNGDGKKDVAKIVYNTVDSVSTYSIATLLGNGDGTFQAATLTATPGNADDPIFIGDVNGDGKDDILMVHPFGNDCQNVAHRKSVKPQDDCGSSVDVLLSNGDGTFANPVNYVISGNDLAGGLFVDFDGDGKLDILAFDNASPANVIELPGVGDGTFGTATTVTTLSGPAPGQMIFADFNGDGKLDFAGFSGNQIAVSLASGSGWAAPVLLTTSDGTYQSCFNTVGDLTGDSKPEIVSVNCYEYNTATIYVNNGDGTFAPGVYYNLTGDQYQYPEEAAIADVNGDGNNDVVISNADGGDITVLIGHGNGQVTAEELNYDTGGYPWMTPILADFNGDGLVDVVVSDDYFNMVYLQGYGDGTFRSAPTYALPNSFQQYAWSNSVATGDFNGDGIPDVVVGQNFNDGSTGVAIYLGNGDGSFSTGVTYGESDFLRYVTVADFNGDGKLDIAATDSNNNIVQILLGNGDGTFSIGSSYSTGGSDPQNIVSGDFNHDGIVDLATCNNTGNIAVMLGNGDGTFAPAVTYSTPGYNPNSITVADINGDGYLDLAVTVYTDGPAAVGVFLANNDNSGTFQPVTYTVLDGFPDYVTYGDLNGDGKLDMAVTESNGSVYQGFIEIGTGNGDGTFSTLTAYPSSAFTDNSYPADIQMFDMNGDGNLDLVYLNSNFGTLAVMYGNGDGTVNTPVEFPGNDDNYGMALADLDGDGATDVVAANDYSGGFSVFLNGNGTGTAPTYLMGTQTPSTTVTAGGSGTYTLEIAGSNGYTGTITFTCGTLPIGAKCSFSPASVVANSNLHLNTTLTITTTGPATAALTAPSMPGSQPPSTALLASFGGIGLVGLVLAGTGKKARQRQAAIVLCFLLLSTLGLTVACGSNGTKAVVQTATPAGSYTVTVNSTGTGTTAPSHSVNVTLIVQ